MCEQMHIRVGRSSLQILPLKLSHQSLHQWMKLWGGGFVPDLLVKCGVLDFDSSCQVPCEVDHGNNAANACVCMGGCDGEWGGGEEDIVTHCYCIS